MFNLTKEEHEKIDKWNKLQDEIVAKIQNSAEPYYGAIGGALTYSFTPTSLGMITKVRHTLTKDVVVGQFEFTGRKQREEAQKVQGRSCL